MSQESLAETRALIAGRFIGTFLGLAVALMVDELGRRLGVPVPAHMARSWLTHTEFWRNRAGVKSQSF